MNYVTNDILNEIEPSNDFLPIKNVVAGLGFSAWEQENFCYNKRYNLYLS